MAKRLFIIALFAGIFFATMTTGIFSFKDSQEEAILTQSADDGLLHQEGAVFKKAKAMLDFVQMPIEEGKGRTLDGYYERRAYNGAPPYIPHEVQDEMNMGGSNCLTCHASGGWVEKFNAYTPIVPHPEKVNCRQCHVVANTDDLFKVNDFQGAEPPELGYHALPGSPPPIPHALFLRENCLSCHAGPGAPEEIRVSHPERINCRQCHAHNPPEIEAGDVFSREGYEIEK